MRLLRVSLAFAMLVIVGLMATAERSIDALPLAGTERFPILATADITSRLGDETIRLTGWADVQRGDPQIVPGELEQVSIEIVNMELTGTSAGGTVTVREQPDAGQQYGSTGQIQTLRPGEDFPASTFFDLYVEVTAPGAPASAQVLHNEDALHLAPRVDGQEAAVGQWPPLGTTYELDPVFGVDNDGDGLIDEDTADDDGDGLTDEDRPGSDPDTPGTGGECGANPDCDAQEGEDPPIEACTLALCDEDGDGQMDEDPSCVPLMNPGNVNNMKAGFCVRDLTLQIAPEWPSFSVAPGGPAGRHPAAILGIRSTPPSVPAPAAVSGNDDFLSAWTVASLSFRGEQNTTGSTIEVDATGFLGPSDQAPAVGGDGDGFEQNPTNAFADDGAFALDEDSGTGTTYSCNATDRDRHIFSDFNIDTGALGQVAGVEVRLDAKAEVPLAPPGSGFPIMCVALSRNGGAGWGPPALTPLLGTVESSFILGGSGDLWGLPLVPADLTNANFRLRITNVAFNDTNHFSLDYVAVNIYEDVEPQPCGSIDNTVWYKLTPPVSETIVVDTVGSNFDTVLAAYTGPGVFDLSLIGCNDNISGAGPSQLTIPVTAGSTYYLQAGGFAGATGDLTLNITRAASDRPYVRIPCDGLGLSGDGCDDGGDGDQDDLNALSYGDDVPAGQGPELNFSVGPGAQGAGGSGVAQQRSCPSPEPEPDEFGSVFNGTNYQVLDGDGPTGTCAGAFPLGLVESALLRDDLDALHGRDPAAVDADGDGVPDSTVYFSLAPGSPSLAGIGASAASVLKTVDASLPTVYAAAAALGLQAGDDIDGLCLRESGDGVYAALDDMLYFSLAAGSPTLAEIGGDPGDLLVPGNPNPTVAQDAPSLGLLAADEIDAMKCQAQLGTADVSALYIGAPGPAMAVGETVALQVIERALSAGPAAGPVDAGWRVDDAGGLSPRWLAAPGDACSNDAAPVSCAGPAVDEIEFKIDLGIGGKNVIIRDLELTCLSVGTHSATLTGALTTQVAGGDPNPEGATAQRALSVECLPAPGPPPSAAADLAVDRLLAPTIVLLATGREATVLVDMAGSNAGPGGAHPDPINVTARLRAEAPAGAALRWTPAGTASQLAELEVPSTAVVGVPFLVEESLILTCESNGAFDVTLESTAAPADQIDPDLTDNIQARTIRVLCLPLATPDFDGDGVPSRIEAAAGLDHTDPDTDGEGLNDGSDPDGLTVDFDGDGCTDAQELGGQALLGGRRNPQNPFDFFDSPPGDRIVDVSDVFAVVAAFGSAVPGGPPYDSDLDRSPLGPEVWNTGPGDGSITVSDVFLAVGQFGHTCSE